MAHFQAQEILIGALSVEAPEQAAEIGVVDMAFPGALFERCQSEMLVIDPLAAASVCGECRQSGGAKGDGGFGDLEEQMFEQDRGDAGAEWRVAQSVADEIVKNGDDGAGVRC